MLSKAAEGLYAARSVKDVPRDLFNRYFDSSSEPYRVSEEIRKSIRFQQHNLLDDPFAGPFDLIICRNVMIYFTEEAKEVLYRKFARRSSPVAFFLSAARSRSSPLAIMAWNQRIPSFTAEYRPDAETAP